MQTESTKLSYVPGQYLGLYEKKLNVNPLVLVANFPSKTLKSR